MQQEIVEAPKQVTVDDFLKLGGRAQWLLIEAVRRYTQFHYGEKLECAWVGLGSATEYKPLTRIGLMEPTFLDPGHHVWWRLTKQGVPMVQLLLDLGLNYENIEGSTWWTLIHRRALR